MISRVSFVVAFVVCLGLSKHLLYIISLDQLFQSFIMLWPFNTVPYVVMTPNHKINFLLLDNYFATVMNHGVNI